MSVDRDCLGEHCTSNGRRPRLLEPTIPREKVYHPLNPEDVPPEFWSHPGAKRFYRFVRQEVELPQRRLRILEHYQEVIVLEDSATLNTTMATATVPEPLLDRCYAGPSLLAYLGVSRFADHLPYYREEDLTSQRPLDSSFHAMALDTWSLGAVTAVGRCDA